MTGPVGGGDEPPAVVAVVPLRDGVSGKSRLASSLDPGARRRLVATLARHVVGVLAAADGVDRVVVVTSDVPFAAETLAGAPATVVGQPADRPGLNAALDVGRERALALGADRLLVVHADLPLLASDDVTALLAAAPTAPEVGSHDGRHVVVAADRHGSGTNLLLVPTTASFRFRFGPGSREAHEAEATRAALPSVVVHRPGTAADLDTIDDWGELPPPTRAWLDGVTEWPE